jgi:hypothetical protein
MNNVRRLMCAMAGVVCGVMTGMSADYFVATDGDDANPGTLAKPFRSPVFAAAKLMPGDTLFFRAGTYPCRTDSTVGLGPSRSGEPGRPITFRNHANEHVMIDGRGSDWGFTANGWSWIEIDGFDIVNATHYGMKLSKGHGGDRFSDHVTIRNCEVHDTGMECIFAFNCTNLLIENCHLHDSKGSHGLYLQVGCHNAVVRNVTSENNRGNSGSQLNASGGGITNALVEHCLLRGNAQGYSLMGAINCTFRNNIIFNNGFDGPRGAGYRELILWTYGDSKKGETGTLCEGNLFENNTFVNLVPPGHKMNHLVESKSGTRNCTFRNNIFVIRGKPVFTLTSCDGFRFINNCLTRIGGGEEVAGGGALTAFCQTKGLQERGTLSADPMFQDVEKGDLRLREGSPCIDAGEKTADQAGISGPGRDIGALERGAEVPIGCKLPWRQH